MGSAGFDQMEIPSFSDVPAPIGQRADAAAYSSEPSSVWTGSECSTQIYWQLCHQHHYTFPAVRSANIHIPELLLYILSMCLCLFFFQKLPFFYIEIGEFRAFRILFLNHRESKSWVTQLQDKLHFCLSASTRALLFQSRVPKVCHSHTKPLAALGTECPRSAAEPKGWWLFLSSKCAQHRSRNQQFSHLQQQKGPVNLPQKGAHLQATCLQCSQLHFLSKHTYNNLFHSAQQCLSSRLTGLH